MALSLIDWGLKTTVTKSITGGEFPLVDLGKKFSSRYQLIGVTTPDSKESWDFGGTIYAGYIIAGKTSFVVQLPIRIDDYHLLEVPLLFEGNFSLFYKPPTWFRKFTLKVFEYQKESITSLSIIEEKINQLAQHNLILESKIDQILNELGYVPPPQPATMTTSQFEEIFLLNIF